MPQGARVKVKKIKKAHQEADTSKIISDVEKENQVPSISVNLSDTAYNNIKNQAEKSGTSVGEEASVIVEEAMNLENGE